MALFDLSGRIALVTGSSRGLGAAISRGLAEAGAAVVLNGRDEGALDLARAALVADGLTAHAAAFDVTDPAAVAAAVERVEAGIGPIDILVNNAGVTRDGYLMMMDREKWESVLRPNLDGAFYCTRAVVRGMLVRRWGRVVNMTSPSAVAGLPGQANYAASKGGLIGLTKTLSRELAPRGVLVNAVMPGLIETDMTAAIPEATREAHLRNVPVGRLGTTADVAEVVAFLSSDAAAYVTGQVIGVDGGLV